MNKEEFWIRRVVLGLGQTLKKLALLLAFGAGIALLSFLVVSPLWYFATRNSTAYTTFVLAVILAFILFLLARRLVIISKQAGGFGSLLGRRLVPSLTKLFTFLFFLAGLYGLIYLYARGMLALAIPLSLGYLVLWGYLKYIKGREG